MTFSILITLIFLLYGMVWIQIPGMLISKVLLAGRLKFSTRLLAGFFMGFLYMATWYYVESLTGLQGLIMVMGPLTSAIALFLYFKNGRPSIFNAAEHFRWTYVIIFVGIYLISMINFQFYYLFALGGQTTQVYHDSLFHTGNIVSLSRSFPNTDIRIDELTFYYHYYYELIFAMCKHIFKMDAFRLYLNGNALVCAFPLTMALITISDRIRGMKQVIPARYFFYCGGLFTSMIALMPLNIIGGTFPISWMGNHLLSNINAIGLALSLTVMVIDILAEIWYDKIAISNLAGVYFLAAVATGFKGTTGAQLVAIGWSVFIVEWFITKNFHIQKLLYNVALTLGFAFTYITVTTGLNPSGANNRSMTLSPGGRYGTLTNSRAGQIFDKVGLDYMGFPWVIIAIVLAVILMIGPCILPLTGFIVGRFKTLITEGKIGDIFDWFAIGSILMGVIGYVIFAIPGQSQSYLVIANAGLIFYCSVKYIVEHRLEPIFRIMHVFFVFGALLFAVDIAYFCYRDVNQNAIYSQPSEGRKDLVSSETMDAYFWLRDNTPEDSIIAVDRLDEGLDELSDGKDTRSIYFYASAFAERQCYLEGYDYSDISEEQVDAMISMNEKFFGDDAAEAEAAIEVTGVNYIVVTKQGHPSYKATSNRLHSVYNNSEVQIYKYD